MAAGHGAGIRLAHDVAVVAAVHGCFFTFLRMVVIAVNRALVAAAAGAGDSHYRGGGDSPVHEHERNQADQRA